MNDLRRLAHVARALDHEGLHAQADAITAVMGRLRDRLMRTAQVTGDPYNGGGLTFDAITRNVPGADFLTKNLASGAFGTQAGLNQNLPGWTYQQGSGPEMPIDQSSLAGYNLAGMSAEQIKKLRDAEYARSAQLSLPMIIADVRQWGEWYKRMPSTPENKSELANDLFMRVKGSGPQIARQAIAQGWPDMPQDIKQMIERKFQELQSFNALPSYAP